MSVLELFADTDDTETQRLKPGLVARKYPD